MSTRSMTDPTGWAIRIDVSKEPWRAIIQGDDGTGDMIDLGPVGKIELPSSGATTHVRVAGIGFDVSVHKSRFAILELGSVARRVEEGEFMADRAEVRFPSRPSGTVEAIAHIAEFPQHSQEPPTYEKTEAYLPSWMDNVVDVDTLRLIETQQAVTQHQPCAFCGHHWMAHPSPSNPTGKRYCIGVRDCICDGYVDPDNATDLSKALSPFTVEPLPNGDYAVIPITKPNWNQNGKACWIGWADQPSTAFNAAREKVQGV